MNHRGGDRLTDSSILFADLAGFTALTEAHGDSRATDLLERFYEVSRRALTGGARVVKTIGDAVMVWAPTPLDLVATAVNLRRAVDTVPRWPAVRAGAHHGPILERNGDCFGATVNVASRVVAHATSGQLLCTRAIVEGIASSPFEFRALGAVSLKNVHYPVELFELVEGAITAEIDCVCRMRIDPATAPSCLSFEGRTYWFCSRKCAETFAADPSAFLQPG